MNKRTLFIHIGVHKTGTTAIQYFLSKNRELLQRNGVNYAKAPSEVLAPKQHRFLIDLIRNGRKHELFTFFRNSINRFPFTLISSECFLEESSFAKWFSMLKTLFDEVKIIIYFRRQDEWIESTYSYLMKYHTKNVSPIKIDEWINSLLNYNNKYWWYKPDWYDLIQSWISLFGRENIIVKAYDRIHFYNGSLLDDFLNIIGLSEIDICHFKPNERINSKIKNRHELEFYRITKPFMHHKTRDELFNEVKGSIEVDNTDLISPKVKAEIMKTYAKSNQKLANEFFNGETDMFKMPSINQLDNWKPYEGLPEYFVKEVLHVMDTDKYKELHDFLSFHYSIK